MTPIDEQVITRMHLVALSSRMAIGDERFAMFRFKLRYTRRQISSGINSCKCKLNNIK